jgi:flagellar basal-body rod modification protein FlgD
MSSAVNAITSSQNAGAASASTTAAATQDAGLQGLQQKETFLKLLVAQIQNQNPLNPADGTQFVSQLAQFSELEQIIQMRSDLETIRNDLEQKSSPATAP